MKHAIVFILAVMAATMSYGANPPLPGTANATNFAVAGDITIYPENPKSCEKVSVEYFNLEGIPTNTTTLSLHLVAGYFNHSVVVTNFAMSSDGSGFYWTNSFYLAEGITQLVASVITDKEFSDDKKGSNWIFKVVACDTQFARPSSPTTTTDQLTIYFRASDTILSNSTSITATANFDSGEQMSVLMHVDTNNGIWSAIFANLPRFAREASILFSATGGEPINTNDPFVVTLIVPPWPVKGDVDGDGYGDVLIQHDESGYVALLSMRTNRVVDAGYVGGGFSIHPLHLVGSADLNADAREDAIWRYVDSDYYVWSTLDGTNIVDVGQLYDEATFNDWEIIAVADFNLDESGDILVRHKQYKIWAVVYLDELEISEIRFVENSMDYLGWNVAAAGDVDGDGYPDLVVEFGGTRIYGIVWMNDNVITGFDPLMGNVFQTINPWQVTGLSDVDGDGAVEFLMRAGDTGYHEIYYTQPGDDGLIFTSEALGGFSAGLGEWRVIGTK